MSDISDKDAALATKIIGADSSGVEQTPVQSTPEGALHGAYAAISDSNNSPNGEVVTAFQGTPLEDLIVIGSAAPSTASDTWIASSWTDITNFASFSISGFTSQLGRGFILWSSDGGSTVNRYETTLFGGPGAFSAPPQGSTHFRVAFQNLSASSAVVTFTSILRYQAQNSYVTPILAPLDPSFSAAITKAIVAGQRPSGDFDNARVQGNDPNNSSTNNLGINEVFRGIWFPWQKDYLKILIALSSDVAGTLFIDFSQEDAPTDGDESSITESIPISYDPATTPLLRIHIPVQSKWVRLRYQNNGTAQTVFSLDVAFTLNDPGLVMNPLNTIPSGRNLAGVVRNIPTLKTGDGTAFQDVPVSTLGNPKQSVAEIHDDILIKPLNSASASQTVLGTSPTLIDSSPLANRRVISVHNEGPLRIAVGHNPGITFNSGSILISPKSTRTFGIDSSVQLYGLCEDLGGIQTTSNRNPASASGTATNPNNTIASDNSYANITANGQTITATGFTAGTTNAIASLRLGIEANRPNGITNTAAYQDSKTGSASNSSQVSTTAQVVSTTNQLYIAAISRRNKPSITSVTGVAGLGLVWTQLTSQLSDDSQRALDIWYAIGTPTGNSIVTASFDSTPVNSHISVTRYSNVNTSSPITDFKGAAANDSTPTTAALSGINKGIAYMAVAGANRTMSAGTDYTLISTELTNAAGDSDSLSTEYKALTVTGSETPTGTLSGNAHWSAISVIINPSEAADPIVNLGYTLSAVPGDTNSNLVITSASDIIQYVDITGDESWVFGDIANIDVVVTGQTIDLVQANIDWVFLELTDTTGNTSRISVWQGGRAVI